jgi:hypothetical protein
MKASEGLSGGDEVSEAGCWEGRVLQGDTLEC